MTLHPRSVVGTLAIAMTVLAVPEAARAQGVISNIQLSPASPVMAGTSVTVTVNGTSPCGGVGINFGDGTNIIFATSTLPFSQAHVYSNAGTFTITANGHGNCSGQASTSLTVRVPPPAAQLPDLTLEVEQTTGNPAFEGSTVSYRMTARNAGGVVAGGDVVVRIDLPAGWNVPRRSLGDPGCALGTGANGQAVLCHIGQLRANSSKTFTLSLRAPMRVGGSPVFTLAPEVDPGNQIQESNERNNGARIQTSVVGSSPAPPGPIAPAGPRPDLNPDLAGSPTTVDATALVFYQVRVRNVGEGPANNVLVRARLPREVDFVRVDNNMLGTCTPSGQAGPAGGVFINCSGANIPARGQASVTIVAQPVRRLANNTQMLFTVSVDPDNAIIESNETNNSSSIITTIRAPLSSRFLVSLYNSSAIFVWPRLNAHARGMAHGGLSGGLFGAPFLSRNFTILS